jgi:hypothetical protein
MKQNYYRRMIYHDLSMFIHSYVASLPCAKKLQKCCKGVVAPLRLALTAQPSAMGNQGHT